MLYEVITDPEFLHCGYRLDSLTRNPYGIKPVITSYSIHYTKLYEIMKAGERAETMARAFNIIHGAAAEDDGLSARNFDAMENEHSDYPGIDKVSLSGVSYNFV